MRRAAFPIALALPACFAACVAPQDNPTNVHDLRVLGVSFEPPELFAEDCQDQRQLSIFASPVTMTALIADPAGQGRELGYELFACARPGDRTCSSEGESIRLKSGKTGPGELVIRDVPSPSNPDQRMPLMPGALFLDGGTPLVQEVILKDTYRGLGGIRMPMVLHLSAGDEEIYASKLLVFSCKLLPEMTANHTPRLPGLLLQGEVWPEGETPLLEGSGPFPVEPENFDALLEPYVVPSYTLKPVYLNELWKISWRADLGTFSQSVTGGTGIDGVAIATHNTQWRPDTEATERDVTFWAVVRDGRGGESWLVRKAHWKP